MKKLPIYELFIEDTDEVGLAIVDKPAIESDFMFFNEEPIKMSFNEEKMMIRGVALIPNKLIYRNDSLGERYIYFSEETILKFVETLMSKEDNKFNIGHTDNYLNAILIESYFASETNEFSVPANSWIVGLKVKDQEAWDRIKSGEFKGFSVEGLFSSQLINLMINNNKKEKSMNLKERVLEALNSAIFPDEVNDTAEKEVSVTVDVTIVDEPVADEPEETAVTVDVNVVDEPEVDETVVYEETEEDAGLTVDEKLALMKEEILIEVDKRIEAMVVAIRDEVAKVDEKVEEFGNQPLDNKKNVETVDNPRRTKGSKATQFFGK